MLLTAQLMNGQTKNEKEERIQNKDFPITAKNILESLPDNYKRLKLYKETDGDKQSFEAKFKYKKKRYSLEFSREGQIEDIEVLTKFNTLQKSIRIQIKAYFNKNFIKHKFIKIQKQFVYDHVLDERTFVKNVLSQTSRATCNFEIIAEVKSDDNRIIKEFTFNAIGTFVNFRILNTTSYEHVLY